MKPIGILACLLCMLAAARAQTTVIAAAYFNMGGFTGHVTITEATTTLQADFTNLNEPQDSTEAYQAQIHPYPIRTGERKASAQCTDSVIGPALVTWTSITTTQTPTGKLTGPSGALGGSLVITMSDGMTVVACANIVQVESEMAAATETCGATSPYSTVQAVFNGAVAGEVILRQGPVATSRMTTTVAYLVYTDSRSADTNLKYRVINEANCPTTPTANQSFTGMLKIGTGAGGNAARTVSSETVNIAVSLYAGGSLEILSGATRIACAPINTLRRRTFTATFGTSGSVSFAQNGPYDSTEVKLSLTDAPTVVDIRSYYLQGECSAAGAVFNPLDAAANTDGNFTLDMYPAGSITYKYTLAASLTECDNTLTTFGVNSLAWRAVAVSVSGNEMCVNAEETTSTGESIIRSKAVFSSGAVRGTVSIRQLQSSSSISPAITTMFTTGLSNVDGMATMKHNWHVHVGRIGYQTDVAACGGTYAGPHYNPFGVFVNDTYSAGCNVNNHLRCELGDTSGKSGPINMDNTSFTLQDAFMPLSGNETILGRSFVIHAAGTGAPRYACANIIPEDAFEVQLGIESSKLTQAQFSSSTFQTQVRASSASASAINVLYPQVYTDSANGCTYITAALQGNNAESVAQGLSRASLGSAYSQNKDKCNTGVRFAPLVPGSAASALTSTVYLTVLLAVIAIFM